MQMFDKHKIVNGTKVPCLWSPGKQLLARCLIAIYVHKEA